MTIQCIIIESDRPAENNDIQLSLVTPTGEVIMGNIFNTVATLEYNGTFSCIAIANAYGTPMMASLQLFVYGKGYIYSCRIIHE